MRDQKLNIYAWDLGYDDLMIVSAGCLAMAQERATKKIKALFPPSLWEDRLQKLEVAPYFIDPKRTKIINYGDLQRLILLL